VIGGPEEVLDFGDSAICKITAFHRSIEEMLDG
jgi:hypothetical protein